MKKVTVENKLRIFLLKERKYRMFVKNIRESRPTPYEASYIHAAFIWADTPQGHLFWQNLDEKFKTYCNGK